MSISLSMINAFQPIQRDYLSKNNNEENKKTEAKYGDSGKG